MRPLPVSVLEEMVEQATADCYNDSEQVCGLYTFLDEALAVPFETTMLGVPVIVTSVDLTADERIVAIVRRNRHRQRVALLDLPLPTPLPTGAEWIAAYRYWATRTGADH